MLSPRVIQETMPPGMKSLNSWVCVTLCEFPNSSPVLKTILIIFKTTNSETWEIKVRADVLRVDMGIFDFEIHDHQSKPRREDDFKIIRLVASTFFSSGPTEDYELYTKFAQDLTE